jgi:hypothetical protein
MVAERGDFVTLHEPFWHLTDRGWVTVAGRTVRTEAELIAALSAVAARRPVFFKDTTDHLFPGALADRTFLRQAVHTFLIRDPRQAIPSHYALNPGLTLAEVGFAQLHTLYRAVTEATGREPVVVDADDLVGRPEAIIGAWCARVGIDYRADSLTWSPEDRPEWGATARWHADVGRSIGLHRTRHAYRETVDNNPVLAGYLAHHLPYYLNLWHRRLPA